MGNFCWLRCEWAAHDQRVLIPIDMAVDANRDGVISFAGNFGDSEVAGKPRDRTEEDKPFRFWVNDDNDGLPNSEGEVVGVGDSDYEDGIIQTARDLEDFTRLWLHLDGYYDQLADGTFKVGLKWRDTDGTPKIKVYKSTDAEGSDSYINDEQAAFNQVSGDDAETFGEVAGTAPLILPADFWSDYSESDPMRCLLFEGSGEGKGQLVMTIHKADGTEIGEGGGVWLDLMNVRKMYRRGEITQDAPDIPDPWSNDAPPALSWVWDLEDGVPEPDPHAEDKTIVFVHGWRMTPEVSLAWGDTTFKRLWALGYKGDFFSFRWPTYHGDNNGINPADAFVPGGTTYNPSEYRAWLSGATLASFVNELPNQNARYLIAHSMGMSPPVQHCAAECK